jgi:hypothetical protein
MAGLLAQHATLCAFCGTVPPVQCIFMTFFVLPACHVCFYCLLYCQTYRRIVRVDLKFPDKPAVSEGAKDFIKRVSHSDSEIRMCNCSSPAAVVSALCVCAGWPVQ